MKFAGAFLQTNQALRFLEETSPFMLFKANVLGEFWLVMKGILNVSGGGRTHVVNATARASYAPWSGWDLCAWST